MSALQIVPDCHVDGSRLVSRAEADESLAVILGLIARLQEQTSRHASLCTVDQASMFENEEAIRWMDTALQDLAATVVGISRSAAQ